METKYKRVVVKVGTSTIMHKGGKLNLLVIDKLARILAELKNRGNMVILVTSGAIGVGSVKMGIEARSVPEKQAAAAVGQCQLMHIYDKIFSEYGYGAAQLLLTRNVLDEPTLRQNTHNTLFTLEKHNIIPVVNENDTVAIEELTIKFGNNDTLAAMVAVLADADLLVLFSDIDGFYDKNPKDDSTAKLVPDIFIIDEGIIKAAGGAGSKNGTGGMKTKIDAARIAEKNGIDMVIANGQKPEALYDIMCGKPIGTKFHFN